MVVEHDAVDVIASCECTGRNHHAPVETSAAVVDGHTVQVLFGAAIVDGIAHGNQLEVGGVGRIAVNRDHAGVVVVAVLPMQETEAAIGGGGKHRRGAGEEGAAAADGAHRRVGALNSQSVGRRGCFAALGDDHIVDKQVAAGFCKRPESDAHRITLRHREAGNTVDEIIRADCLEKQAVDIASRIHFHHQIGLGIVLAPERLGFPRNGVVAGSDDDRSADQVVGAILRVHENAPASVITDATARVPAPVSIVVVEIVDHPAGGHVVKILLVGEHPDDAVAVDRHFVMLGKDAANHERDAVAIERHIVSKSESIVSAAPCRCCGGIVGIGAGEGNPYGLRGVELHGSDQLKRVPLPHILFADIGARRRGGKGGGRVGTRIDSKRIGAGLKHIELGCRQVSVCGKVGGEETDAPTVLIATDIIP